MGRFPGSGTVDEREIGEFIGHGTKHEMYDGRHNVRNSFNDDELPSSVYGDNMVIFGEYGREDGSFKGIGQHDEQDTSRG